MNLVRELFEKCFYNHTRFPTRYHSCEIDTWLDSFDGYELVKKEPEIARCTCGKQSFIARTPLFGTYHQVQ